MIVFLVSFTTYQRNNEKKESFLQSFTNDIVGIVDKGLSFPLKAMNGSVQSINSLFNTYTENDTLKKKVDELSSLKSENENYKKENEKLKDQLKINATLTNYDKLSATVISRSPNTWQNLLIIDKGKKDGIKVNMPVMGSEGLIGRVVVVNELSSKVELLTSANQSSNHFPVMIATQNDSFSYGLLESYDEKENAFVITQLTESDEVKAGDTVSTSGLGGNSPKGLYVGKVKKIKSDAYGLNKEIYVTPASSMYDISVVTVIQRLAGSGN